MTRPSELVLLALPFQRLKPLREEIDLVQIASSYWAALLPLSPSRAFYYRDFLVNAERVNKPPEGARSLRIGKLGWM